MVDIFSRTVNLVPSSVIPVCGAYVRNKIYSGYFKQGNRNDEEHYHVVTDNLGLMKLIASEPNIVNFDSKGFGDNCAHISAVMTVRCCTGITNTWYVYIRYVLLQ